MNQSENIMITNIKASKEWLIKSWHNLSTAQLLYDANHYTDIIAVELHYSCEKTLKSLLAVQNKKIPKTHDLIEIYNMVSIFIDKKISLEMLDQITAYHIEESYPTYDRPLPPKDEIQNVLIFTHELFKDIYTILNLKEIDIKK